MDFQRNTVALGSVGARVVFGHAPRERDLALMHLRRRDLIKGAVITVAFGCGSKNEGERAIAGPSPAPSDASSPTTGDAGASDAPSTIAPTAVSPILILHPEASGRLPYMATALLLEGAVPLGQSIVSGDDPSLSASVLTRWPDGSACVAVVAGELDLVGGSPKRVVLAPGPEGAPPLSVAQVGTIVTNISLDFGTAGTASLASFASPVRVHWANARVICCRYRVAIGSEGLEALIDVHAFASGRAFVEVVIENGRVDASAEIVTAPSTKTYADAKVAVNGKVIATVSSPAPGMAIPNARMAGVYSGGHEPLRAWYCATWVGGDPAVEITHEPESMHAHPWFFRPAEQSGEDLAAKYAAPYDVYVPWATCRLRAPGMDGTGDDEEIALFTECQTDYFLSGSKFARRAVLATGLGPLSCDINWRHVDGEVPTHAQLSGKNTSNGKWPRITTEPRWGGSSTNDGSHIPAVALVPFLCRPSPCFIDIAQKELAWNHTNYSSVDGSHPFDQARSRAWRLRNYAIAIFLTPDGDASRKDGYRNVLVNSMSVVRSFLDQPWNVFRVLYDLTANDPSDHSQSRPNQQASFFMHHFGSQSFHAIAGAKVLRDADQQAWNQLADRMMEFPLRWINDATGYEWRAIPYQPTIGVRVGNTIDQNPGNLVSVTKSEMQGAPPAAPGPWLNIFPGDFDWTKLGADLAGGISYPAFFFAALCAAVERDVPGAAAAWDKVVTSGGVTDFPKWREGYRKAPRFNRWPRNR